MSFKYNENKHLIANQGVPSYFPINKGFYDVKPGLYKLGTQFGNGNFDSALLQIDSNYFHYRKEKLHARKCSIEKYYQIYKFPHDAAQASLKFLIDKIETDSSAFFTVRRCKNNSIQIFNNIVNEHVELNAFHELISASGPNEGPDYVSALDAIAAQIQEDIAIIVLSADGKDYLSALHLCFPNHWSAQEKISKNFIALHEPVPGMDRIFGKSTKMLHAILQSGPFVRFAWGLSTDMRLNHHPTAETGVDPDLWIGRQFDKSDPRLYLRIERQTITGLPYAHCIVFTIKTYFTNCELIKVNAQQNKLLQNALLSMSPSTLDYKGLAGSTKEILSWLKNEP